MTRCPTRVISTASAVIGEPFDDGQRERAAGDHQQQRRLVRDKDAVEHRLHQPGAPGGAGSRQTHQQKGKNDALSREGA